MLKKFFALLLCTLLALGGFATVGSATNDEDVDTANPVFVEAGYRHSFALDAHGTLWAWGAGEYGRLGTGLSFLSYTPEEVELENAVEASAGWYHSLFRTADGSVYAAGCNYDCGQLGDGTGIDRSMPVKVMDGAIQVVASRDFSAALKADGTLWTWGKNDAGQLGLGHTDSQRTPAQVALEDVAEIAAGESFMLARTKDGSVYAWGDNAYGQIDGSGDEFVPEPRLLENCQGARAIRTGNRHALTLLEGNRLLAWGDDYYNQLGRGEDDLENPEAGNADALNNFILENGLTVTDIDAGGDMSALCSDGTWYLWGDLFGATPTALEQTGVESLSLGYWHALIAQEDGTVWGRGDNSYFQLGLGGAADPYLNWMEIPLNLKENAGSSRAPVERDKARPVEPFASEPARVAAGYYTSFAITDGGDVWAWGRSDYGQLGAGDAEQLDAPEKLALKNVAQVAAGDYHTLFVTENGQLYGTGCSYDYDQLATGKFENENEPVFIMDGVQRAWAGRDISAALDENGALWVWGANDLGQLGLGHTDAVDGPTQVPLKGIVDVAVGKQFMAVLLENGTVWTWGDNTYGQLGVGEGVVSASPVQVNLAKIISIAAGSAHMLALDEDGRVWAWGAGYYGQLGNGGDSDRFTPVEVEAAQGSVAIFAGGDSSGARMLNDETMLWGAYFYIEPYAEQINYYNDAMQEYEYIDIADVSMGSFHILATDADGNVYATGDNNFGQLGVGFAGDSSFYYGYDWKGVGLNLESGEYVQPSGRIETPDNSNRAL